MAYTQYLKQAMTLCLFTFAIRENNNLNLIPLTRYHQGNGSREQEPDGPAGEEHGQAQELWPYHGGGRGDGTSGDRAETQEGAGGEGDHREDGIRGGGAQGAEARGMGELMLACEDGGKGRFEKH